MNKNSTSQSAFTLRLLVASVFCAASVVITLLGFGAFSAEAQLRQQVIMQSTDPLVPVGFDCSRISELGIDKQENLRAGAIMIACGEAQGGKPSASSALFEAIKSALAPLAYGATDVDLVTGAETSPNITQSETFTAANPDNPNQIVVAYNDSRGRNASPINISGASVSTDGGNTFIRLTNASGQSPFSNTVGDPVILYNRPTATWFTIWLDGGCGGQGLGGYKSTTPSNANTWTNARQLTSGTPFIRDVQITGDLATGDVYVAGMNEGGGGFPHNDSNLIFRSTDGGNTWTNTYTGPTFSGPGRSSSGYFATMYNNPAYWRHEGWGEPAAFNHVVHLVYAARNTGNGDPGDVFYIRSTDSGVTFSPPLQLNTDIDHTKAQWQPNLSVSPTGTLLATWYDETPRVAASCQPSSPSTPCYQMYSRKSNDNGVTWLAPDTLSDVASPLPLQPDPGIQATYAGDYDYGSALLTKHLTSWTDGRVTISGTSQQDAFTDRELVGFAVTSTDPACSSVVTTQPTDFIVNLSDAVNSGTVDPIDFTV